MTDFLDEKREEIQARLKELKPLVDEYQRLEAAERALSGVADGSTGSTPASRSSAGTRRRRGGGSGGGGRRGRPRGSGTRAAQALDLVRERPGITIPQMAQAMGIQQNYLYRVLPGLAEEGKVTKSGRGWHLRT
jgi:hypothetical protein